MDLENLKDLDDLDPDLKKLLDGGVESTSENNETSFFLDPLTQSYGYSAIYNAVGKGPTIICEDDEAQEKIRKFNKSINANGENIRKLIYDVWIDNLNHEIGSLWVVKYNDKLEPELWRVPPETIRKEVDPVNGWIKFTQTRRRMYHHKTELQFLKGNVGQIAKSQTIEPITIPNWPEISLNIKLFRRPPVASISKFIVFKHIVMYFMRKYGEKMWAPLLLGKVGDPKSGSMPATAEEMEDAMNQLVNMLVQTRDFGVAAIPGYDSIEVVEPQRGGEIYLKIIEAMDKQIMYGLFASMSLKQGAGVYKGNDEEKESYITFLETVRQELTESLKRFWTSVIVPGYDEDKIKVEWPPLRSATIKDIADAYEVFVESGIFIDADERREIASMVWPQLKDRKVTPEESKRLDDLFITMKSPSQPGESTADIVNKGSNRNGSNQQPNNKDDKQTSDSQKYDESESS